MPATSFVFSPTVGNDWSQPSNWSPVGSPGSTDEATINAANIADVTTNSNTAGYVQIDANATLNILSGGLLSTGNNSNPSVIGVANNMNNIANITGPNALWDNLGGNSALIIGNNIGVSGFLNISNTGQYSTNNAVTLGNTPAAAGTIILSSGGIFSASSSLVSVGGSAGSVGQVNQSTGAVLTCDQMNIAGTAGSQGSLIVSDINTSLNVISNFNIGGGTGTGGGDATFTLSTGAVAQTGPTILCHDGGNSIVTIDGMGTSWKINGDLLIGHSLNLISTLTIQNSAQVTANSTEVTLSDTGTGELILSSQGMLTTASITGGNGDSTLTFTGGILQAASDTVNLISAITGGQATFGAGGATIDTQSFATTIPQSCSGTGTLTKLGAGSLSLTGTNTFGGDITISSGTLEGEIGVGLPITTVNVIDDGLFIINQNSNISYSTNISGTGALVKNLSGNLTLAGINSYSGGTQINSGTLTGTTNSFGTGNILNDGALIFDQVTTDAFDGNINGSGSLTKEGAGTVILTGTNTYGGGTTITSGALQGTTLSLQGDITDSASGTLIFDQTFTGSYSGNISGTGYLIKQGGGTVVMTGNSGAFTGDTNILAGGLAVNGTLLGTTTISSGAALSGIGTLADVINNGTISPGNSIGTIHVTDFTNSPSGIYNVQIDPSGSTLIAASNTATINGGILEVTPYTGVYTPGEMFTILTANSGVSGAFSSTVLNNNLKASVDYLLDSVILTVLQTLIYEPSLKGNPLRVANYLNEITNPSTDLLTVLQDLATLSPGELKSALDQLHPAPFEALPLTIADSVFMINSSFFDRLSYLRHGYCCQTSNPSHKEGFWVAGLANTIRQKHSQDLRSFKTNNQGVAMGFDYQNCHSWLMGFGLGYSHSNLKWSQSTGHVHMDNYYMGPYVQKYGRYAYIEASLIGYVNRLHSVRNIHFASLHRRAKSTQNAFGVNPHLGLGLILQSRGLNLTPFANIDYYFIQQDEIKEHGANSLNLNVIRNHANLMRYEGGLLVSKNYAVGKGTFSPNISLGYVAHQILHGKKYVSSFQDVNFNFSVFGTNQTFSEFEIGGGFLYILNDSFSLNTWYNAELGYKRIEQEIALKLSLCF